MEENIHLRLWAKSEPKHMLWRHLLDVAAVCHALLPRFWPDADARLAAWLPFLCALHDIGKADPFFQAKDADLSAEQDKAGLLSVDKERRHGFRHESRSEEWLTVRLKARNWSTYDAQAVGKAIRAHHALLDFPRPNQKIALAESLPEQWEPIRDALAALVQSVIAPPSEPPTSPADLSAFGIRLAGLLVLADWIASNTQTHPYETLTKDNTDSDPHAYYAAAKAAAEKQVAAMGLSLPTLPFPAQASPLTFAQVWPDMTTLRPAQAALEVVIKSGCLPGLAILEAPMGEGKTEMSIYLAEEWGRQRGRTGTYIGLPTQATSNQLHGRYRAYLQKRASKTNAPRLVHGMAWLRDDPDESQTESNLPEGTPDTQSDDPDAAARALEWFAPAKRALLAPEGVGTIDQALMGALFVKHGFLRLFGLAGKCLIVDEVHAYDQYMTTLLCRLLAWCRVLEVPVILLSATLSRRQKAALVKAYLGHDALPAEDGYPLLSFAPWNSEPFAVPVETKRQEPRVVHLKKCPGLLNQPEQIARAATEAAEKGGCVCVLVNTVKTAQAVFEALKDIAPPNAECHLFHARFRAEKRAEIEDKVLKKFGPNMADKTLPNPDRPASAILVATQVVEQSLDLDFDVMLTDLAPIDLLLQRTGRLHRHAVNNTNRHGHDSPVLPLFLPDDGALSFGTTERVYARETLLRTVAALHERALFTLPAEFRCLIEQVYGDRPLPSGHPVPADDLVAARESRAKEDGNSQNSALQHLVALPDPEEFAYEPSGAAVDEAEEGETQSYFHAQTRQGEETVACLLLMTSELITAMQQDVTRSGEKKKAGDKNWTPPRRQQRAYFRQMVNLPKYFVLPDTDKDAPRWLRHRRVILAPGGQWTNERGDGVYDDPILGVLKIKNGEIEQ